ncbi:Pectinesterase inhibitor [Quillaja saponaria]|uniref:Pectinesterase inhibitor n=1 Tax=Quillaja saponaria TaxID=32244 RepID=A0AAD7QA19_QUISA|nr:Pectinesterase inhibitor [Quillaja saponaria]
MTAHVVCLPRFINHVNTQTQAPAPAAKSPELMKICSVTGQPELCASSVLPYLKGDVNPDNVLKAELEAVKEESTRAMAYIEKTVCLSSLPALEKNTIGSCGELFSSVLDDVKSAQESIDAHQPDDVSNWLSGVQAFIITCNDGFEELKVVQPKELIEFHTKMQKLTENSLDILFGFNKLDDEESDDEESEDEE